MTIKKTNSGWLVDIQPGGRGGKRFRKSFTTKAEALQWETWLKAQVQQSPEWRPGGHDKRKLSELVELWFNQHGINLRDGEGTKKRLLAICQAMKDPIAEKFTADDFAQYRANRMADNVAPATLNREHATLRAVFNELKRLGQWKTSNPLENIRRIKSPERELSFLINEQIMALLVALDEGRNADAKLVTLVCLATGARWSEAELLRTTQIRAGAIHFTGTKSGKNRSVPISIELERTLQAHMSIVPKERFGRLFVTSYGAFRKALERAQINLPKGQLTHVLRHTFASHFMMNGGNILTLQRILGHGSLMMTMRYAHLAPEHLQEAKGLNPLAKLEISLAAPSAELGTL